MFLKNINMKYIELWLLFSYYTIEIHGSTHWMVTEGGLIQPRLDSPFQIAHSYDLLAFLNQDARWDNIINLHHDLVKRQQIIKRLWAKLEKDSDVTVLLNQEESCVKAGQLNMLDWYTSFLEDGKAKVGTEEFVLYNTNYGDTDIPDCKKISSLTYSMCVFEHLESMKQRENLSAGPELSLPEQISPEMTIDQFGHWLTGVLKKNSSSWLHYNMASLYWRVRGNAPKAMECSRRAVHYAPRVYKDIALLSMGMILHRSKMTEDAIIILGAATDHDPQCPINHFVLANAFAVLGDFNNSIKHFDISLKLNPSFDLAVKHKHGALCHSYMMKKMLSVRGTLDQLRDELAQYSNRENLWLKSHTAFVRTMKHPPEFDPTDLGQGFEKITQLTGLDIKELKKEGDKYSLIQYFLDGPTYNEDWLKEKGVHAIESAHSLKRLVQHIGKHTNIGTDKSVGDIVKLTDDQILKEIGPTPTFPDLVPSLLKIHTFLDPTVVPPILKDAETKQTAVEIEENNMSEFDTGIILYPTTTKVSRVSEDFDKDSEWPSNRLCKETAPTFPDNLEAIYQVFLPFENKGIRLRSLLTDKLGVRASVEHELPWHPPACPNDKEASAFTQKKSKPQIVSEVIITGYLRQKLLEYEGDGDASSVRHMQDAEIGQRIYAAMQMKLAPKWLLYTLASLYWRVRSNNVNALHCAMTASRTVEQKYKDIVLVSIASIYLEMGYFDEALAAAEEAFKINLYEPATNFILAELNMVKKHRNTHMFHLKQVVRVESNFMNGLARTLLHGWACLFKQVNVLQELGELELNEGDICTQVEPGMSMVCEKDGNNCHLTNIQCFSSHGRESSTLVRMLELKDDNIQGGRADDVDARAFDALLRDMPAPHDTRAHAQHYQALRDTVAHALRGCGDKGCASIQPEDLALKEEDCTYQHLELGYWLHITSFKQLLSDPDSKLSTEILSMSPSTKKVPECRLNVDPTEDFFLDRLMKVDTEGWEPVLSLMHQFAEMFNFYDYVTLGAKIAKYVEMKPTSWVGAAAAGWWCGAGGRGSCAARCLAAARALAPPRRAHHAPRALAALLHIQNKQQDAKEVAYLSFYAQPKSKIEAFLVGVSHTYLAEYEPAVWMYRYALTFDDKFLPAKACLHATMCLMLFGDSAKAKAKQN